MDGYIKVYRKLMFSPVWQDPLYLKLWMYCLMKATHKERDMLVGNQLVKLNPGDFITGRASLADDLNKGMKPSQQLSERTWYRYLENLEKFGMLSIKKTNKYSVISIVKWADYQEFDQQLTINCPSVDQQLTTNKNVKNVKNVKKKNSCHKRVYDETSIYYQLANYFVEQIRLNNPEFKEPNLQTWSNDIRLMMEIDKRTEEQIRYLMKWVQEDDFECANVLSPSKLRKRFDQLVMKVKQKKKKAQNVVPIKKQIDWEAL